MLAAVTGLAYTVGNLLRLEGYLAYGLPLPIVLAALRSGPLPALKTLTVAVLLLLILMGPVRAATYLLVYGVLSLTLGVSWALRLPWLLSVPLGALARIAGYFAYIALSSFVTNENLLALMMTNVYSLLDQLSVALGTSGAPPPLAVAVVLASLLFVNSLMYVFLMHVLYAIMLRAMGMGQQMRLPKFAERFVAGLPTT
ncbi:hypothetical protein C2E21_2172 [Chlorella sorokiniana]|uniref:DUF2232 domain-containing protein n=1 Tax=Chlorella sorokiniana TaxID=3076 RepID=A0A2P6TYZ7_CHLSO|nr:hypothetical protein C2E21_2172 [Chlorella sorokiniana]|eukprot:PRW59295.1 hypothetical protein C2E21_2172 [Chlorella sorokiniana]